MKLSSGQIYITSQCTPTLMLLALKWNSHSAFALGALILCVLDLAKSSDVITESVLRFVKRRFLQDTNPGCPSALGVEALLVLFLVPLTGRAALWGPLDLPNGKEKTDEKVRKFMSYEEDPLVALSMEPSIFPATGIMWNGKVSSLCSASFMMAYVYLLLPTFLCGEPPAAGFCSSA